MTDQNDNQGLDWLDKNERKDARRRSAPKAAVVYEAIRREGEEELSRNTEALVWSGLAAGLSMGFSFLMEALLAGTASSTDLLVRFFIPTLLGNIVGGVAFVAAINHAQVSPDRDASIRGSHP
jgi:formate/nitrite transporter FocA (FNT family)